MVGRIRLKDHVIVLSGKDKGRRGAIVKVLDDDTVVVEGVNMVKKHQKPRNSAAGPQPGGIVEREAPLPASKVAIWNPASKKGDRVGYKRLADGRKVRVFKSNGEQIDA
ncbi:MAG TPA: 50S ribosomal protein L24 [Steroidobacteraceae bacterium]|nr:50S ribosomal protein L24 [Steroidobacteraceae bacterium]HQW07950.1 50S ribosomal protein L24 [Steroidobacteraceae bacterium]HQX80056.1 50S ribosomal protein L24 [Steroidobacteraceae bacterium]HQZ81409.1 50S ribosomal protein L24 [Steroidobacteraceae bacterium]